MDTLPRQAPSFLQVKWSICKCFWSLEVDLSHTLLWNCTLWYGDFLYIRFNVVLEGCTPWHPHWIIWIPFNKDCISFKRKCEYRNTIELVKGFRNLQTCLMNYTCPGGTVRVKFHGVNWAARSKRLFLASEVRMCSLPWKDSHFKNITSKFTLLMKSLDWSRVRGKMRRWLVVLYHVNGWKWQENAHCYSCPPPLMETPQRVCKKRCGIKGHAPWGHGHAIFVGWNLRSWCKPLLIVNFRWRCKLLCEVHFCISMYYGPWNFHPQHKHLPTSS